MNWEQKQVAPEARGHAPRRDPLHAAQARFDLRRHHCVVVPWAVGGERLEVGSWVVEPSTRGSKCAVVGELRIDDEQFLVLAHEIGEGADRSEPFPAIADMLTPRELQIALQVALGKYNKQIAHEIKVSEWTVSSHLRRIFAKLGVRTRAEMVARVLQDLC